MMYPKSRILYKYRKFDKNCLEILLNRELWFAQSATLNDPFEAESSINEVLDAVWAHHPMPLAQRENYESYVRKQLSSTGICSFSRTRKNQLMWSHYADNHKGVCFGFKEQEIGNIHSKIYPIDVTYQDEYPFEDIIKRTNYFGIVGELNSLENIAGDIFHSVHGTKFTDWKYEKERRLVYYIHGAKKFEPDALTSITFGLRMPDRDKNTLRRILSGNEWSHIKWFQAKKSKTKYLLDLERLR